jgi:alpha-L-fucosidase
VFDHRTPEYATSGGMGDVAWETVRGVGHSFGYKANEIAADFLSGEALVDMFLRIVGNGGNLLINIGPRADGSIPEEQAGPLRYLGAFLKQHGRAIYGSRPWSGLPQVGSGDTLLLPVAARGSHFALVAGPLPSTLRLPGWGRAAGLALLDGPALACRRDGDDLVVDVPPALTAVPASVLEIAA